MSTSRVHVPVETINALQLTGYCAVTNKEHPWKEEARPGCHLILVSGESEYHTKILSAHPNEQNPHQMDFVVTLLQGSGEKMEHGEYWENH